MPPCLRRRILPSLHQRSTTKREACQSARLGHLLQEREEAEQPIPAAILISGPGPPARSCHGHGLAAKPITVLAPDEDRPYLFVHVKREPERGCDPGVEAAASKNPSMGTNACCISQIDLRAMSDECRCIPTGGAFLNVWS